MRWIVLIVPIALLLTACEDVDWDWEARWWERPTKQVHPDRRYTARPEPAVERATTVPSGTPKSADRLQAATVHPSTPPANRAEAEPVHSAALPARTERAAEAPRDESVRPERKTETVPEERREEPPARPAAQHEPARSNDVVESAAPAQQSPPSSRPPPPSESVSQAEPEQSSVVTTAPDEPGAFYQLYLVSEPAPLRDTSNVKRIKLEHTAAYGAAAIVAELHPPVGTGGAEHQQYLIYQDPAQWRAAAALAPMIDRVPTSNAVGSAAALQNGIAAMLDIERSSPAAGADLVTRCQTALAQAAQSVDLGVQERWMAGILAGRVLEEQKFDYAAARTYYDEAARITPVGSLERLTALWWRSESFDLEGKQDAAKEAGAQIAGEFAAHPYAHAVQRVRQYGAPRRR